MQGSEQFIAVIQNHLQGVAAGDAIFAKKLENPDKSIKDCITYILNTVQKSGNNGFADAEIFGMATHYYDEEKIEVGNPVNVRVVVNHTAEATPRATAPKQAAVDKPAPKKKEKPVAKEPVNQLSIF